METEVILYIVFGLLVLALLFQRKQVDKKAEFDSYNHNWNDELKNWSNMTSFSELKILSKYAGELRFGPVYIHLKTEPENIFEKQFFGDWFYRTEKGVYLQKWNSNPIKEGVNIKINNDLIFYDIIENRIKIIEPGIKSFHWNMEKDQNNKLTLISNNGKAENRIKITV
ncbi:MAG: hypothetical protein ABJL44_15545 [Algibacter sp.]